MKKRTFNLCYFIFIYIKNYPINLSKETLPKIEPTHYATCFWSLG